MLIVLIIQIIISVLAGVYIVINGARNKMAKKDYLKLLLFNVIIIIFGLMMYRMGKEIGKNSVNILCIVAMFGMSLSLIPVIVIFRKAVEKISIDNEYEFLVHKGEMNRKYFEIMGEHERTLSKIRHDFANQVDLVETLIAGKEESTVGKELLKELRENIESTRVTVYSNSKMINIVLKVLKSRYQICDIDVFLNSMNGIDELDFCMIADTLIDAITTVSSTNIKLMVRNEEKFVAKATADIVSDEEISKRKLDSYIKYLQRLSSKYAGNSLWRIKGGQIEIMVVIGNIENK